MKRAWHLTCQCRSTRYESKKDRIMDTNRKVRLGCYFLYHQHALCLIDPSYTLPREAKHFFSILVFLSVVYLMSKRWVYV